MDSATMRQAARRHRAVDSVVMRQRGAVAIIVALSLAILIGFVGLAIDGGHLYVTKTELQNGADACALAASYELTGAPNIPAAAFARAEAAGLTVVQKNNVDFQHMPIAAANTTVEFGTSLTTGGWVSAATAPGDAKYVRCTIERSGIAPYLMQVVGAGNQTVSALAAASLSPSQTNCAVPMALCQTDINGNEVTYDVGSWYSLNFKETGGTANYSGNFRWVDFGTTGQRPLADLLAGSGQCDLPPPISGSCPNGNGSTLDPGCAGKGGSVTSLGDAYNTRFGLYKGIYRAGTAPMDFTGYSYRNNWTLGKNAYDGTSGSEPNFTAARDAFLPTQSTYVPNGGYTNSSLVEHKTGADRRLVTVAMVDCRGFLGSGTQAPIRDYACVLLLDPYDKAGPGTPEPSKVITQLEYLGRSSLTGSPCATSGVAGNTTSQGPMVPSLVR